MSVTDIDSAAAGGYVGGNDVYDGDEEDRSEYEESLDSPWEDLLDRYTVTLKPDLCCKLRKRYSQKCSFY